MVYHQLLFAPIPYKLWIQLMMSPEQEHKKSSPSSYLEELFAVRKGLEPSTSGVTGRHSNQTELPHQGFASASGGLSPKRGCKDS